MMTQFSLEKLCIQRGTRTVCHDLHITFKSSDIIGILGQNGVGKSTLLQSLAALHPWQLGNVCINQNNISHFKRRELAQSISLLLQESNPSFSYNVEEYLKQGFFAKGSTWPWDTAHETNSHLLEEAIKIFDLSHLMHQSVTTLSGGERRRVDLATLYIQNPKIYLLDEPFNHLDLKHQYALQKQIQVWANNQHIILLSTHDLKIAQTLCTHLLLLFNDGKYLFGTTEKLFTKENIEKLFECPLF